MFQPVNEFFIDDALLKRIDSYIDSLGETTPQRQLLILVKELIARRCEHQIVDILSWIHNGNISDYHAAHKMLKTVQMIDKFETRASTILRLLKSK